MLAEPEALVHVKQETTEIDQTQGTLTQIESVDDSDTYEESSPQVDEGILILRVSRGTRSHIIVWTYLISCSFQHVIV